ncbi:hypothetical protein OSB04_016443 [Centaurea solstitialis]|uniref:F-box domain-containing protein n=1 Tax=Centaurea solstitialis TaxID=347529 RepID=A0AA38TKZ3_9ASTR|nr:hypothetical protein OSB04_016443 [Centaurea solstitialis]
MSDSDNKDVDLIINQIVMNNIRAMKLVREFIENELIGNEDIGPSNKRPRGPTKDRGREEGDDKLVADYFSDNPMYDNGNFSRRFRMSHRLFLRIVADLERELDYFKQQWDARGCVSAIRQLAYGSAADASDEYLRMSETTSRDCLENFCQGDNIYESQLLTIFRLYTHCMNKHTVYPACLVALIVCIGTGKIVPSHGGVNSIEVIILDRRSGRIARSMDLARILRVPGATNDIIVVNQPLVFNDIFEDKAPDSSFVVNDIHYKHEYYLADGIYPEWSTFVKAFRYPTDERRVEFKKRQESARKDIERTFATLKDKWHVVKRPARVWSQRKLQEIMYTCIILDNMIRGDEGFSHYHFDPTFAPIYLNTISNCYFRKTLILLFQNMEDLPTELTIDILLRLPVKTIIHCQCVCKKWRNLVSDSFFVNLHLSTGLVVHRCKHYEDPGILEWVEIADRHRLHHDPFRTLDLNLVPILENSKVNRMVSVNGLICLWRISPILKFDDVYICNPVTREMIILPRQQQKYKQSGFLSPAFYGIGVSSLTGEYKVVKLSHPGVSLETVETDVYTLGTRQWRNLGQVPYPIRATSGPFLNDHFHWIITDHRDDDTERICSFDLNKETFQIFPSHSSREENDCYIQCLAVLKGCLCICYEYESQLTIWVMKEYGIRNSWHKEVVITYAIIPGLKWPCLEPISVTEDLKDGSILLTSAGKMWAFYPRSETIEEIGMISCYHNVISYRPSFLRLEKGRDANYISDLIIIWFLTTKHLNLPMAMLVRSSKHITVVAKVNFFPHDDQNCWNFFAALALDDHLLHVRMQQVVELSFELVLSLVLSRGDLTKPRKQRNLEVDGMGSCCGANVATGTIGTRTLIDPSMEALPAELMIDIFSRLPVKTIVHCKLVCKKWRSLVLDSSFVNLHLSRSRTGIIIHHKIHIPSTDYARDQGTLKWVDIEDKVDHHLLRHDHPMSLGLNKLPVFQYSQMYQTGSVNGLICLCQYSRRINHDDAYICNPVTREFLILPRQRFWREGSLEVVYGFGVSSLTGEYKVVRAYQAKGVQNGHKPARPSVMEAEVYTLGTGHWRNLGPDPVTYRLNTSQEFYGPFLNNRCHWIVSGNEDAHDNICTFDLDKETFQLLPSPPPPVKENWFRGESLAILKGCLCKLDTYASKLTIWVMKEYGINNSWHKQAVISRSIQWPLYQRIHLIADLKDGSFLMAIGNKLWAFDSRRKTIEDTKMFDPYLSGWAYRPSFLKLQNFESERKHRAFVPESVSKNFRGFAENFKPVEYVKDLSIPMVFSNGTNEFVLDNGFSVLMATTVYFEKANPAFRFISRRLIRLSVFNNGTPRKTNQKTPNFVWLRTLIDPSMEALPVELTIDILSRLPLKTIIHCKLVCNKWWNLVSDSSFVKLHLSRSPTGFIIHP